MSKLSSISSSTRRRNKFSFWEIYWSVIIPQIIFYCSVFYFLAYQKNVKCHIFCQSNRYKKKFIEWFSGAFQTTILPELNVEILISFIKLQLRKFNLLIADQISSEVIFLKQSLYVFLLHPFDRYTLFFWSIFAKIFQK